MANIGSVSHPTGDRSSHPICEVGLSSTGISEISTRRERCLPALSGSGIASGMPEIRSQNQTVAATIRRMDHHTVAIVSIAGSCLDVLGSLYLAYDLLGGQHGPLRLLTRAVTYSIIFGIGYGLGLGLFFGLASGIATGITLSIEFSRASRGLDHYSLPWEGLFSAIRGFAFGAGLYRILGFRFAIAFAVLVTAGQVIAYSNNVRPALDYVASRRPRLTRRQ